MWGGVPQRKILNIADMVVCGEREGPLMPQPKVLGMLSIAENAVAMDVVLASLMGINYKKIPSICYSIKEQKLMEKSIDSIKVYSNKREWDNVTLNQFLNTERHHFLLSDGWSSCSDIYV